MSRRRRDDLYPGPSSRMRLGDVARLGSGAVVTPKIDGIMVRVLVGSDGHVSHVLMRSGEPAPRDVVATFAKVRHVPHSVLVGELECMTEWSQRTAATRGYPLVHLWDVQRLGDRDLTGCTYQERRSALLRAESALVADDPDQPNRDRRGVHHAPTGEFAKYIPRAGWRRMPIVPSMPASKADLAWSEWVERDGHEGLVVAKLAAPFGSGKAKVKPAETIDVVILAIDKSAAVVDWNGHRFTVSARSNVARTLKPGDVAEVLADGWEERRVAPKHPRFVRRRDDLRTEAR